MDELKAIQDILIAGDGTALVEEINKAVSQNIRPEKILYEGLIPGMDVIGQKFKNDELYIPEVFQRANIFKQSVDILKPLIMNKDVKTIGKVLIGTVKGDMHDVGKNLVVLMLEASGFEVIDLGVDVAVETFVKEAKENDVNIIGMSALLTTTMPNIKKTIQAIKENELIKNVKTIIGGACISQAFADEVGANAYGHDAIDAVEKIKMLISRMISRIGIYAGTIT